jgi:hypothetical protein
LASIDQCFILYVTPEYFNLTADYMPPSTGRERAVAAKLRTQATLGQLQHVGVTECNKTLAATFQSRYESIVFVQTSVASGNSTIVSWGWDAQDTEFTSTYDLTDCWASAASGAECQIFFNSTLMMIVVVANIIKCGVMILMLLKFTQPSLVTRGDAIASFLSDEDQTTRVLRNVEKRKYRQSRWVFQNNVAYVRAQKGWGSSPSGSKWCFSISM